MSAPIPAPNAGLMTRINRWFTGDWDRLDPGACAHAHAMRALVVRMAARERDRPGRPAPRPALLAPTPRPVEPQAARPKENTAPALLLPRHFPNSTPAAKKEAP